MNHETYIESWQIMKVYHSWAGSRESLSGIVSHMWGELWVAEDACMHNSYAITYKGRWLCTSHGCTA